MVDVLQIPAFLCRQTDLLVAAGRTGKPVNVKKGQWMQPEGMAGRGGEGAAAPARSDVAVTERGTFFGYGDLVVDMRSFPRMRAATGVPVIFDATHSVQQPGQGEGGASGGLRRLHPAAHRRRGGRAGRTGSSSRRTPTRRARRAMRRRSGRSTSSTR